MSINPFRTTSGPTDELMIVVHDKDRLYTHSDVVDILSRAEALGFSLEKGSELDNMTVAEIDRMVSRRQ